MKLVIAYDGTLNSKTALKYGLNKLRDEGGRAFVVGLFHSAMFVDYDAGPKAVDVARAEAARRLGEAKKIIEEQGAGLWVKIVEGEGEPESEVTGLAEDEKADLILAPAKYKSMMKKAPCPVVLIPGAILVPVDSTENHAAAMDRIAAEALATGSKVVLMGVLPVHMYGRSEADELKKVERATRASIKEVAEALKGHGVETVEVMRPGYPDEEILKAMDEFNASIIMIPTVDDAPSELSKAASIILDEPEKIKRPVVLVPQNS